MATQDHTPGPWTLKLSAGVRIIDCEAAGDYQVATLNPFNVSDEANARLIAAAPDQHDACVAALDLLDHIANLYGGMTQGTACDTRAVRAQLSAAIRKATVAALALVSFTGCATTHTSLHVALQPRADACQILEVRPTWQGIALPVVCWDKDLRALGMGVGFGMSTANVATSLIGSTATVVQAGATLGAGALIADGMKSAVKSLDGTTIHTVTSGTVTAEGALSIPPVTGSLQLLPPVAP